MKRIAVAALLALGACASSPFESVSDAGGCKLERIAAEPGILQFSFNGLSPDGRTLAIGWEKGEARGAYLLDLRDGSREDLPPAFNNAVSFSPDGRKIIGAVYTPANRTEILELDRASGETRVFASNPSSEFLPSYSRDMKQVYFNSYRTGRSDLYVLDVASGAIRQLTGFAGYDAYARLSPDERTIAFHRDKGGGDYDIVLLDLATGHEKPIASTPKEDAYPAWSPDGKHMVFTSARDASDSKTDLYVMKADGSGIRRLTTGAQASYPNWAANGADVYFVSQREGHGVWRLKLDHDLDCVRA
jgi:TolB protein